MGDGFKVIIDGKEWTLPPFCGKAEIFEQPNGDRYAKLDVYLIRKLEESE
jgi:hypothetical protein